jgi:hypothetical protein
MTGQTHGLARRWSAREVSNDVTAMVAEMNRADYLYRVGARIPGVATATCSYVGGSEGCGPGTGCIVGEWLRRQGVDMNVVAAWEASTLRDGDNAVPADTSAEQLFSDDGPSTPMPYLTRSAVMYVTRVQSEQDNGAPWGQAILRADYAFGLGEPRTAAPLR